MAVIQMNRLILKRKTIATSLVIKAAMVMALTTLLSTLIKPEKIKAIRITLKTS